MIRPTVLNGCPLVRRLAGRIAVSAVVVGVFGLPAALAQDGPSLGPQFPGSAPQRLEPSSTRAQPSRRLPPADEAGAPALLQFEEDAAEPATSDEPSLGAPSGDEPDSEPAELNADAPAAGDGDALIREAHSLTKGASSIEDFTRVYELLQQGLRSGPSEANAAYARTLMAWTLNRRGEELATAGQEEEALNDFAQAVSLDSRYWRALHNRGVSYAMQGKYEEALSDFNRSIGLNRNYANTWFNRGEIRYEQGDFEGAVDDYTQSIRLAPRDAAAYNSRGHAYYRQGRVAEAMRDYDRAVELDPKNAGALVNRGDALAHQRNYASAARDFRAAIQLNPELGRAYQSAAWLMATCPDPRYRNPQLGLDSARKAVEIDGDKDFRYLDTLAAAYASAGQFDQAVEIQNEVLRIAPEGAQVAVEDRLRLYQQGHPFREASVVSASAATARQPDRNVRQRPPAQRVAPQRQPQQRQPVRRQPVQQQQRQPAQRQPVPRTR